jgi:hypothetical protein
MRKAAFLSTIAATITAHRGVTVAKEQPETGFPRQRRRVTPSRLRELDDARRSTCITDHVVVLHLLAS